MQEGIPVRQIPTDALSADELVQLRDLLWSAFGAGEDGFSEDDWQHALGGRHFLVEEHGRIVSHAAVVERELHVGEMPIRAGYVEAVGTLPEQQRRGYGSAVMRQASDHIRRVYELGALGTGEHGFYERLGWQTWRGPTFARTPDGPRRTPVEDGFILVLTTPTSPSIDFHAPLSCDWRPGDVW